MSLIVRPPLSGVIASAGGGGGFPAFPSITGEWARWEPFRETGYSNGDFIEPLTDWSGNNRHFTHAGADHTRPKFETGVLNGRAVANGDHADNNGWDTGPDMSALTAVHYFEIVLAKDDPASQLGHTGLHDFGTDSLSDHFPYTDGNIYTDAFSTVRRSANPTLNLATQFRLLEYISTTTEWTLIIDGTETLITTGTNTVAAPSVPWLLRASGADSRHRFAGGYLFSAELSGGDRTSLIDYLNDPDIFNLGVV